MMCMKYKVSGKGTGFLIMAAIAASGIATGAVWAAHGGLTDTPWIHQFFRSEGSPSQQFLRSTVSALVFLGAVFIAGTSAIGQPAALGLLFYRGFGAGVSAALLYGGMGVRAVPVVAVFLLPKAVGYIFTAMLAVREAVRSSCGLARFMAYGDDSGQGSLRLYLVRFFVLAVMSAGVSALNAVLTHFVK